MLGWKITKIFGIKAAREDGACLPRAHGAIPAVEVTVFKRPRLNHGFKPGAKRAEAARR